MSIPFLDIRAGYEELRDELSAAWTRCMESGWYILGPEVTAFEEEFASYCNVRHCIGVGTGLDALHLLLRAADIGPGDEVIVPGHTFIATWLAVSHTGARPVPVEPCSGTWNIDPDRLRDAIGPNTKAIVAVHLYGQPASMDAIREVADEHGLPVVARPQLEAQRGQLAARLANGLPITAEQEADDAAWAADLFAGATGPAAPDDDGPILLARYRRRTQRVRMAGALGGAALILLMMSSLLPQIDGLELRPRGADGAIGTLQLSAVLDAETLLEVSSVPSAERVVFAIQTPRAGFLCLQEERDGQWHTVFPAPDDAWRVDAGRHLPMLNGAAQSYRPDDGTGSRSYRALLDPATGDCAEPAAVSTLTLQWLP